MIQIPWKYRLVTYSPVILAALGLMLMLLLGGCRRGPHVDTVEVNVTKYRCKTSASRWVGEQTVALCDSQAECNAICAGLPR